MQTPENLKTECGEESFNPDGLAQRSIKLLKDTFPDIEVQAPVKLSSTFQIEVAMALLQWPAAMALLQLALLLWHCCKYCCHTLNSFDQPSHANALNLLFPADRSAL